MERRPQRREPARQARKKGVEVLLWIVTIAIALAVAALAFLYFSPSYSAYVVRSGSMTPAVNMGDMVIVGPADGFLGHGIQPGTIITYRLANTFVTHRVQSVNGGSLVTKGDAVEEADSNPVASSQVVGAVVMTLPKLGYLSSFLHTKSGWFLLVIIPTWIVLALITIEIVKAAIVCGNQARGEKADMEQRLTYSRG